MGSNMDKKPELEVIETIDSSSGRSQDTEYDEKDTKRLIRKIDIVLLPFLSLLYLYVLPAKL
jgi:hypothetical protein